MKFWRSSRNEVLDEVLFSRSQIKYNEDIPTTVLLTDNKNPFSGHVWQMIESTDTMQITVVGQDNYRARYEREIIKLISQTNGGIYTPFVGINTNGAAFVALWKKYSRSNRETVMRNFLESNIQTEARDSISEQDRRDTLKIMLQNDAIQAEPTFVILGNSTDGFGDMHLYQWDGRDRILEEGKMVDNDKKYLSLQHRLTVRDVPDILMAPTQLDDTIIYEMDERQIVKLKHPMGNTQRSAKLVQLMIARVDKGQQPVKVDSCWEDIIFPLDKGGTADRTTNGKSFSFVSTAPELLALCQFGNRKLNILRLTVKTLSHQPCYPTVRDGNVATYSGYAHLTDKNAKVTPGLRRVYVTYNSRIQASGKHIIMG